MRRGADHKARRSLTSAARDWCKAGHRVVGTLAYAELKGNDSTALARVAAMLNKHPEIAR